MCYILQFAKIRRCVDEENKQLILDENNISLITQRSHQKPPPKAGVLINLFNKLIPKCQFGYFVRTAHFRLAHQFLDVSFAHINFGAGE